MRLLLATACLLGALALPAAAEAAPSITVNDVAKAEGNSGNSNASFTISLSEPAGPTGVTVTYATANGTATAPADYDSASGVAVINSGQSSATVTVPVKGDTLDEADETFTLNLSNPVGSDATIGDAAGTGTITDDDATPSLSVNNVSVTEADTSNRTATFTVRLSAVSGRTVTVNYATNNGTAVAPGDYTAAAGTVTIPAGSTTRTVSVTVRPDTTDEASETFNLDLSNPASATISDGRGVGTIRDNDGTPSLRIRDVRLAEGNRGVTLGAFVVTLSRPSQRTITVRYATSNSSAVAGSDYVGAQGTLTVPAGRTQGVIFIGFIGDRRFEATESFRVRLSSASNASIADSSATGVIVNDDPANPPPVITSFSMFPRLLRSGQFAVLRYGLTERAVVRLRVQRRVFGRRLGPFCVAPARAPRGARPCFRFVYVPGVLIRTSRAGQNVVLWRGRIGGRRLGTGVYRFVAQATDFGRARSRLRFTGFRVR